MAVTVGSGCRLGIRLGVTRGLVVLEVPVLIRVVLDVVALLRPHVVEKEFHFGLEWERLLVFVVISFVFLILRLLGFALVLSLFLSSRSAHVSETASVTPRAIGTHFFIITDFHGRELLLSLTGREHGITLL